MIHLLEEMVVAQELKQALEESRAEWKVKLPVLGGASGDVPALDAFDGDFDPLDTVLRRLEELDDEGSEEWVPRLRMQAVDAYEPHPNDALYTLFAAINPATIKGAYAVITAVVEYVQAGQAAAAEKEFREGVLDRLDTILSEVRALQRQVAELGVLLIQRQGEIAYRQSLGEIQGALGVIQVNWPGYRGDRRRAQNNFDALQQALVAAANHGAAMAPHLVLGFATLMALLAYSESVGDRPVKVRTLKRLWLKLFRDLLDPNLPGSLTSQRSYLSSLVGVAWKNLADVPRGRTLMGTHNYGNTNVFMVVQEVTAPGWQLDISRQEEDIPQGRERVDDIRGGRGRFLFGGSIGGAAALIAEDLTESDIELLMYTTSEAALRRDLPHPTSITGQFGGDRHGSFYDEWIANMRALVGINLRVQGKVNERLAALDDSIKLVKLLAIFCES